MPLDIEASLTPLNRSLTLSRLVDQTQPCRHVTGTVQRITDLLRDGLPADLRDGPTIDLAKVVAVSLDRRPARVTEPVHDLLGALSAPGILIVAAPDSRGTVSGVLKLIFDRLGPTALSEVIAVPVIFADSTESLARISFDLGRLLVDVGAQVAPGFATNEQADAFDDRLERWVGDVVPILQRQLVDW